MSSPLVPGQPRIQSIDVIRGAVMVLMAIDHVRVYSGLPAGGPEPGIFFTRWVTHFCAPVFVFFAGTAAFMHGSKLKDLRKLSRFLVTRGLMLVALELTLVRFSWTFNFHYSEFVLAGVIWMLGWCMVLLALFVSLRPATVGIVGLGIIFFQQLFSFIPRALPAPLGAVGRFLEFFYSSGLEPLPGISILYVIIPWIGVMAAGYGFGTILLLDAEHRKQRCLQIGLCATALFLLVGSALIFLKPAPADAQPFIFRLLNQQKYPASQLFLLMTLGPAIALIPLAEKAGGWLSETLAIFGRVPFFYYLLHIPLIHVTALGVNFLSGGAVHQEWYDYAPFTSIPVESRWSLGLLYVVFIIDVTLLYAACRWYVRFKFDHPEMKWLRFV